MILIVLGVLMLVGGLALLFNGRGRSRHRHRRNRWR